MSDDAEQICQRLRMLAEEVSVIGRTENDRWWQVFCAVINPASRKWLRGETTFLSTDEDDDEVDALNDSFLFDCATIADAAVRIAKKKGRI